MDQALGGQLIAIIEIIWVNIILSGDNAVVIAMACRGLPPGQRRAGMLIGAGVAVALRIVFTLVISLLLTTPFVKIVGSLLLLWIGAKLISDDEGGEHDIKESDRLWDAVRTVAVADAVMSLDNVLAIAAVAKGSTFLLVLGLLISVPLIVAGAALIMKALEKLPILAWLGAALLGWIAGDMLVSDPFVVNRIGETMSHDIEKPAALIGAVLVVAIGYFMRRRGAATA